MVDLIEGSGIHFASKLSDKYVSNLEELFFFHPAQSRYKRRLLEINQRYGLPEIIKEGYFVSIKALNSNTQCLFMVNEDTVLGALVYIRESRDTINVIHFVTRKLTIQCSGSKLMGLSDYFLKIFLRNMRSIKGVKWLNILYRKKCVLPV